MQRKSGQIFAGCGAAPDWQIVMDKKLPHFAYRAGYDNEQFGISVGTVAEVHDTHDGGATWTGEPVLVPRSFGILYFNRDASLLSVNLPGKNLIVLRNPKPLTGSD